MAEETQLLTATASARSYKPEVEVDGKWYDNGYRYCTEAEALDSAQNLYGRWLLTTGCRATPSDDAPLDEWVDGGNRKLDAPEGTPVYHAATSVQL